jgi:hypothetical protein
MQNTKNPARMVNATFDKSLAEVILHPLDEQIISSKGWRDAKAIIFFQNSETKA